MALHACTALPCNPCFLPLLYGATVSIAIILLVHRLSRLANGPNSRYQWEERLKQDKRRDCFILRGECIQDQTEPVGKARIAKQKTS